MNTTANLNLPLSWRLSGSALKVIAVLSMIIDHLAFFMLTPDNPLYAPMRCIGRIAFPVFACLVAEGFAYSRNRWKYFWMLMGFGILAELPWILLNGNDGSHNVMFTLALGVTALAAFDRLCEHGPLAFASVVLVAFLAWWIGVDYDWRGILMIFIFYLLRQNTINPFLEKRNINFPSQNILQLAFVFPLMAHYGLSGAILASLVIFLYDGNRGFIRGNIAKYGFYAVYPVHLMIIWALMKTL